MPRKTALSRYERYLKAVADKHGPAPENPFKSLRTKGEFILESYHPLHGDKSVETYTGDTLISLADKIGISKQALIRTEQGTYPEVPARILEYWSTVREIDYLTLEQGYTRFQDDVRRRHRRLFGTEIFGISIASHATEHPQSLLRNSWVLPNGEPLATMNITEMAKLLCLNQSVLAYFEDHVKQQASVPKPLLQALAAVGYTRSELDAFEVQYSLHRSYVIGGVLV